MISQEHQEQAAGYALGVLDASERAEFEAALAASAELRREVDELRRLSGLLAMAAPSATAPTRLRDRIIADAKSTRRDAPSVATSRPAGRAAWRVTPWLLAAASLAGVLVMNGRYSTQRREGITLAQHADSLVAALAARDSVIALLLAPDVETAKLVSVGRPPSARLYWNRTRNQVILAAFALPPAASGRTYQLWGIAGGKAQPVSLGTFNTTAAGEGRLIATVPAGLTIAVGAVTEEPAGGSPQPTSTPFLVGQIGQTR